MFLHGILCCFIVLLLFPSWPAPLSADVHEDALPIPNPIPIPIRIPSKQCMILCELSAWYGVRSHVEWLFNGLTGWLSDWVIMFAFVVELTTCFRYVQT